jgi:hypothetical protein
MRKFCVVAVLLTTAYIAAAQQGLGVFDAQSLLGNPAIPGMVQYNAQTLEYTMQGAGANMWFNNDQFPHISPDDKWIMYLSYPNNIDPPIIPGIKKCIYASCRLPAAYPRPLHMCMAGRAPSMCPAGARIANALRL